MEIICHMFGVYPKFKVTIARTYKRKSRIFNPANLETLSKAYNQEDERKEPNRNS